MTKKMTLLWFLSMVLSAALGAALSSERLAWAQAAPGVKIGIVDVDKVAQNSKVGKAKFSTLEAEFKPKGEELKRELDEINRLKKEFTDKASVWSEDTKKQKANDLELKMRSFERKRQDYEDQARKREQEALAPLEKGLSDVIEKMATEQNFSLILDLRGMLIFYNPKLEITDEVTRYFDAQP